MKPAAETLNGLLIREPYVSQILDGQKTWEIRGSATKTRGTVGLIRSASGLVIGRADIVDVIGPLSLEQLKRNAAKMGATRREIDGLPYDRTYAWVLENAERLATPIPYVHPSGAVIWVKLSAQIRTQVLDPSPPRVRSRR